MTGRHGAKRVKAWWKEGWTSEGLVEGGEGLVEGGVDIGRKEGGVDRRRGYGRQEA